jgi:hypothetical protein
MLLENAVEGKSECWGLMLIVIENVMDVQTERPFLQVLCFYTMMGVAHELLWSSCHAYRYYRDSLC